MIGMPFVPTPDNVRLSGPHYLLENLHAMQSVDDEANRQRSASLADQYLRKRSATSSRGSQLSASPPVTSNRQMAYNTGPPDVPFHLAQIRASKAVPMTTTVRETPANADPQQQQLQQQQQQQQQRQPQDPFISNYEFDMTGVMAHIPNFPLVSPETHMSSMPAPPYDMTAPMQGQQMVHDVISPHDQFVLTSPQQLGMYAANYGDLQPQAASDSQVFSVPYREFG
jgi:hypothetical protein